MTQMLQIDLPYACAGIEVESMAICVDAAPIFRWMIGKSLNEIVEWTILKGGTVKGLFQADSTNWHGICGTNE